MFGAFQLEGGRKKEQQKVKEKENHAAESFQSWWDALFE